MGLLARAHDRITKIRAHGGAGVEAQHIAEALQYRSLDRGYWGS